MSNETDHAARVAEITRALLTRSPRADEARYLLDRVRELEAERKQANRLVGDYMAQIQMAEAEHKTQLSQTADLIAALRNQVDNLITERSDSMLPSAAGKIASLEGQIERYEQWLGQINANMGLDPNSTLEASATHADTLRTDLTAAHARAEKAEAELAALGPVEYEVNTDPSGWRKSNIHEYEHVGSLLPSLARRIRVVQHQEGDRHE